MTEEADFYLHSMQKTFGELSPGHQRFLHEQLPELHAHNAALWKAEGDQQLEAMNAHEALVARLLEKKPVSDPELYDSAKLQNILTMSQGLDENAMEKFAEHVVQKVGAPLPSAQAVAEPAREDIPVKAPAELPVMPEAAPAVPVAEAMPVAKAEEGIGAQAANAGKAALEHGKGWGRKIAETAEKHTLASAGAALGATALIAVLWPGKKQEVAQEDGTTRTESRWSGGKKTAVTLGAVATVGAGTARLWAKNIAAEVKAAAHGV